MGMDACLRTPFKFQMHKIRRILSMTALGLCSNRSQLSWTIWRWHSIESSRPSSEQYVRIYYWVTSKYHISIFSPIYSTGKWLETSSWSQIPRKSSQTLYMCFRRLHTSNHWTDIQPDLLSRLLHMVGIHPSQPVTIAAHLWFSFTGFSFISKFRQTRSSKLLTNPPDSIF
jgi:hypothetical protein